MQGGGYVTILICVLPMGANHEAFLAVCSRRLVKAPVCNLESSVLRIQPEEGWGAAAGDASAASIFCCRPKFPGSPHSWVLSNQA